MRGAVACDGAAAGACAYAEAQIRRLLSIWRDNDAKLRPVLEASFLLRELAAISEDLAALGASGLAALDYLDRGERSPEPWRTQQRVLMERAATAKADLLLMVVGPVRQLIEASTGQTSK